MRKFINLLYFINMINMGKLPAVKKHFSFSSSRSRVLELALEIPKEISLDKLSEIVEEILSEIRRTKVDDTHLIYEAINILRNHLNIIEVLINRYNNLVKNNYNERILTIQVVGELRRPEGYQFLKSIVWGMLPKKDEYGEELSPLDYEEIIQSKAIEGITYLRSEKAFEETINVMINHKSLSVKTSAIDTYMWNLNDNKESAKKLYELLPFELHKYIERPRFHRNMDARKFQNKLNAWINQWGNSSSKLENAHHKNKSED